ncbi:MAG: preprotein translocase subunit SecG [Planctomycetota bacterium]
MGVLIGLLMIFMFITCLLLVVVILFQDNKAGGLAGALGGGAPDSPFGARAGERLARWTVYLGVAFFLFVIALGILNKGRSTYRVVHQAPSETPAAPAAPAAPPADVPYE